MGISHDIRPKKVHPLGHSAKKKHTEDIYIDHPEHIEIETDSLNFSSIETTEEHQRLEDEFFSSKNSDKSRKEQETNLNNESYQNNKSSALSKWIITLFMIALVGVIAYQNYDTIGQKIGILDKKAVEENNEEEETYTSTSSSTSTTPTTTTPAATTTPATTTPTTSTVAATQTIDKSTISLSVLNGNGITGSADAVADILKAAGFNPTNITNARKFTYTDTIIYYQTGKLAEAQLVEDTLSTRTTSLEESNTIAGKYHVLVVVGKN